MAAKQCQLTLAACPQEPDCATCGKQRQHLTTRAPPLMIHPIAGVQSGRETIALIANITSE
ncbi:MAG: hypothetical protein IIC84_07485 [Chloroflexi bacterium]|nr:hypothetical protein [Chloroflexota bacterium]